MRKLISIIFIFTITMLFASCNQPNTKQEGIYKSENCFGLSLSIPDSWHQTGEAEYADEDDFNPRTTVCYSSTFEDTPEAFIMLDSYKSDGKTFDNKIRFINVLVPYGSEKYDTAPLSDSLTEEVMYLPSLNIDILKITSTENYRDRDYRITSFLFDVDASTYRVSFFFDDATDEDGDNEIIDITMDSLKLNGKKHFFESSATPTAKNNTFDISSCQEVDFTALARNPEKYEDVPLKGTGRVVQVIKNEELVGARISMRGTYGDVIMIAFLPEIMDGNLLEDDIVNFYGKGNGEYPYTSATGVENSLPLVFVKKIELV